ncbi:MAG: hypothetical protein E7337_02020 [Clostridiales bacterium]|nr:hypothetical protein [Clostridiales bacterium]
MKMKRFLSLFVCIALLTGMTASCLGETQGSAQLPASLKEIRTEAFLNDPAIEKVVVPEGTEKIGSRAFAGSGLKEIELPDTITYIADDAFEGCDDLVVNVPWGSYAHKWASFRDVECVVIEPEMSDPGTPVSVFAVESLSVSDETDEEGAPATFVKASVTAVEACVLETKVIVDGKTERVLKADVEAGTASLAVKIPVETALPGYYTLEAALVDAQGSVLSNVLTDISHTQVYESASSATRDEYDSGLVMDFGETGFAVLEADVIQLSGEAVDLGGDVYTLSLASAFAEGESSLPKVGDVLMLNVGGAPRPVKVGKIEILESGVIRIQADKSITLSEVYSKIDINGYAQTDGGESEIGGGVLFNYTNPFTKGSLTLTPDLSLSVNVMMKYDKKLLGEDYFEMSVDTRAWGSATAVLSGEFSTDDLKEPIELEIFKKAIVIPHLPVPAQIKVTLPLKVEADASGTLEMHFDKTVGFKWDSVNGYTKKDPPWVRNADACIEADFLAETGPKLTFGFDLMGLVEAWIFGQVGVKLTGELLAQAHFGTPAIPDKDEVHACNLCVDMDALIFGSMGANLKYNITEEVKGDKSCELLRVESEKFLDLYYSLINEEASCHKGEKVLEKGECPNYKYRIDFATEDMHGKTITGIEVDVTDGADQNYYGYTPYSLYMYEGNYTAGADFEIGRFEEKFSVMGHADTLTLKERETVISGVVTDNATGSVISGVSVTLYLPDGSTRATKTDSDGAYKFGKLPGGEYSLSFEKTGYSTRIVEAMTYAAGQNHSVNVGMNAPLPYIKARLQWPGSGEYVTAYAKAIDGSDMPWEIALIPGEGNGHTGLEDFNLKYREDKALYPLIRTSDDPLWMTVELHAADMGDGLYTYALLYYSDTTNWVKVYKEDGDTLKEIMDFSYIGGSDNVWMPDGPESGYVDYTKPIPSTGGYGIRESYVRFDENDKGAYDMYIIVEESDYSAGYAHGLYSIRTTYRLVNGEMVIVKQEKT